MKCAVVSSRTLMKYNRMDVAFYLGDSSKTGPTAALAQAENEVVKARQTLRKCRQEKAAEDARVKRMRESGEVEPYRRTPMPMNETTREQWMLAQVLVGAVNACNAPFCETNEESDVANTDPSYIANVAKLVAEGTSRMALEDAIQVLEAALSQRTSSELAPLAATEIP